MIALGMDHEAGMDLNSELNLHASQEQMTCSWHTKAEQTEPAFGGETRAIFSSRVALCEASRSLSIFPGFPEEHPFFSELLPNLPAPHIRASQFIRIHTRQSIPMHTPIALRASQCTHPYPSEHPNALTHTPQSIRNANRLETSLQQRQPQHLGTN